MLGGGFLGAGKTIAIRSLGMLLTQHGQTVAVITNDQAAGLVDTAFLKAKVLTISAIEGTGLEKWLDLVQATPPGEMYLKDIDYDQYAKAEADMGWLNAKCSVRFLEPADENLFTVGVADRLKKEVDKRNGSIGNLKILAMDKSGGVKCGTSLVEGKVRLEDSFSSRLDRLDITINIRVTLPPDDTPSG